MEYRKLTDNDGIFLSDEYVLEMMPETKMSSINGEIIKKSIGCKYNRKFAKLIYRTPKQISRYIDNEQLMSTEILKRVCLVLQIDPIQLLNLRIREVIK